MNNRDRAYFSISLIGLLIAQIARSLLINSDFTLFIMSNHEWLVTIIS